MHKLKAPFPWFGNKSKVAGDVWSRFGDVRNYVEPFMGSLAMLLARPQPFKGVETVNDADGFIANFWRAVKYDPEAVAHHADWPVNENDLHARHAWLTVRRDDITRKLEGDPDWYDAKIAGWWAWGQSCWIGIGWCSGDGPWCVVEDENGERRLLRNGGDAGRGVSRQLPNLGEGRGVSRQLPVLSASQGVCRQLLLVEWMAALSDRLRRVRVCCGDFSRLTSATVTTHHGLTAVFLDPPYSAKAGRRTNLYSCDSRSIAHAVREWAVEQGKNPLMRIALCGYEGEHAMPDDWECFAWKTNGGFGNIGNNRGKENRYRERIWFSPHCLRPTNATRQTTNEKM